MEELGLSDLSEMRIGSHERRGISGGEMRRLSIGLELVAAPDILILDEPVRVFSSLYRIIFISAEHNMLSLRRRVRFLWLGWGLTH
jgi:ABC-type multidrug transport system ATPase subunit